MIINHGELMQDGKWRKKTYYDCVVKFLFAENIIASKVSELLPVKSPWCFCGHYLERS